jgi:hypothetical protein
MVAENESAKVAEAVLGHDDKDRATHTDISNPDREGGKYADPSGEKMKALVWMGKNDVRVGTLIMYIPIFSLTFGNSGSQQAGLGRRK